MPPRVSPLARPRRAAAALLTLALLALLAAGAARALLAPPRDVVVELRSWIVAGRGRHMFAEIKPPSHSQWPADLPLVVEYWSTALRDDYAPPPDESRAERICRMPLGHRVVPGLVTPPDDRLEATYRVTLAQAKELARDRIFEHRYFLLGPNSTSGLRAALEAAGLKLPPRALSGAGILGEFPGVDISPGREAPREKWGAYGLSSSPRPPQSSQPAATFAPAASSTRAAP